MAVFHRFCGFFPLFLMIVALAGCSGANPRPYGSSYPAPQKPQDSQITMPQASMTAPVLPQQTGTGTKAAILLPLSGPHAALGHSMLKAAQLAVFDLGYENFELLPQDTAKGAGAAANAALQSGAHIILGPLFAEDVRAVKTVTAGGNTPVLAFSTDWTLAGGNIYIMGFLPFGQVDRIAAYAASKSLSRVGVAASADAYGTATSTRFENQALKNGMTLTRALSDTNGYDAVFVPAGSGSVASLLQRVSNKLARKLGTGLWDDPRVAAMPEMNGAWFAAPAPSARAGFEQRFMQTYGEAPQRLATLGYDATALAAALSKSGDFTARSLTNPNGFAGVDGIIRFNREGLAERGLAVLEIRGGKLVEIDPAPTSFVR